MSTETDWKHQNTKLSTFLLLLVICCSMTNPMRMTCYSCEGTKEECSFEKYNATKQCHIAVKSCKLSYTYVSETEVTVNLGCYYQRMLCFNRTSNCMSPSTCTFCCDKSLCNDHEFVNELPREHFTFFTSTTQSTHSWPRSQTWLNTELTTTRLNGFSNSSTPSIPTTSSSVAAYHLVVEVLLVSLLVYLLGIV